MSISVLCLGGCLNNGEAIYTNSCTVYVMRTDLGLEEKGGSEDHGCPLAYVVTTVTNADMVQ